MHRQENSRKSGRTSRHGQPKPSWHIVNQLTNLDLYGRAVPTFNLKGETHINTSMGGLLSLVIMITTLAYTSLKFTELYTRADPFINETKIPDYYAQSDTLDLDKINFKFAFSIEGYYDVKNKNDPRYLRQYLRMTDSFVDGSVKATSLPYHECTDEDYNSFSPPTTRAKDILESVKADPDRRFYCIDDDVDKTIFGQQPTNYRTLEILFIPCNVENSWDDDPDPISEDCVRDLEAQQAFLGSP